MRERLRSLREICSGAKDVLVLIYSNPDPDALASALALKEILGTDERSVHIGYTGAVGRPENASMIKLLKLPAARVTEEDAAKYDIIAIVDAQPQFFVDFGLPRCDIVIDHHPLRDRVRAGYADIRPEYLSTSAIMTEYLRAARATVTGNLASALYYGIKTDTRNFLGELGRGDTEAIRWLGGKADREIVSRIEFSQFSRESLDYFGLALQRRRLVNGVIFSHLGTVPFSDVCVQVADFLIRVENVYWAVVSCVVDDTLVVVFRNDGIGKDAGLLARSAFGCIGSAGGHRGMARAEVKQDAISDDILLSDDTAIERFVLAALTKVDPVFAPVLKSVGGQSAPGIVCSTFS